MQIIGYFLDLSITQGLPGKESVKPSTSGLAFGGSLQGVGVFRSLSLGLILGIVLKAN